MVAVPILAFVMVLIRHILMGEVYGDTTSEIKPSGTIPADAEPTIALSPFSLIHGCSALSDSGRR